MAFPRNVREVIWARDKGVCKKCGVTGIRLQCSHIDHSRKNPGYANPSNGRLLCLRCHVDDHKHRENHNGLSVKYAA